MSRCEKGFTNAADTTPGASGFLWECPNMKEVGKGFDYERYECPVCGERDRIDYDEIR